MCADGMRARTNISLIIGSLFIVLVPASLFLVADALQTMASVTVSSPNGGENITSGANFTINWTGTDDHYWVGYTTNASASCDNNSISDNSNDGDWIFLCHQTSCSSSSSHFANISVNSTTVRIKVAAHNASHTGKGADCSNNVFTVATRPGPPSSFAAFKVNVTAINLTWVAGPDTEVRTGYRLYRNGSLAAALPNSSTYYLDGSPAYNTSYTYNLTAYNAIGEGANSSAGNSTYDTAPTSASLSPANAANLSSTLVTFNCSAADDFMLASISLFINLTGSFAQANTTNVTGTANWSALATSVSEGYYVWSCMAADNVSQSSFSSNRTLLIDPLPPAVSLVSPANGSNWTANHTAYFLYNVTDTFAVSNCTLLINGTANATRTGILNATTLAFNSTLRDNTYNWSVQCTDSASNSGTSPTYMITVNSGPAVTLNSPAGYLNSSNSTINFNCSAFDTLGLANITLYHNMTGTYSANSTTNITGTDNSSMWSISGIPEGHYIWSCSPVNVQGEGNLSLPNRTLTIDRTAPLSIQNISLKNKGWYWISINWTLPAGADISAVSVYLNGTWQANVSASAGQYNLTWLNGSTTYLITAYSVDYAGNVNWTGANITNVTDAMPPYQVNISAPTSGTSWTSGTDNTIVWTASGNISRFYISYTTSATCPSAGDTACAASGWTCIQSNHTSTSYTWSVPGSIDSTSAKVMVAGVFSQNYTTAVVTCTSIFSIRPAGTTTTTTTTSPGGGGAGATPTPKANATQNATTTSTPAAQPPAQAQPPKEGQAVKDVGEIKAGEQKTISVGVAGVSEVVIAVKNDTREVRLTVSELVQPPENISLPPHVIYKLLDISISSADNISLTNATIKFDVNVSWLAENKFKENDIFLLHYKEGQWKKLATTMLNRTNETLSYEAVTDSLSVFAIAGVRQEGLNIILALALVVILVIIGVAYYLYRKNQQQKYNYQMKEFTSFKLPI